MGGLNKTYWAYQGYPCKMEPKGASEWSGCTIMEDVHPLSMELVTYLFSSQESAFDFAYENGEFEGLFKDAWIEKEEEILFEIRESELSDYEIVSFIN